MLWDAMGCCGIKYQKIKNVLAGPRSLFACFLFFISSLAFKLYAKSPYGSDGMLKVNTAEKRLGQNAKRGNKKQTFIFIYGKNAVDGPRSLGSGIRFDKNRALFFYVCAFEPLGFLFC